VAGGVIGGAVTGPRRETVVVQPVAQPVVQPVAPCNSSVTQTTDNSGNSSTTQSTNCPN
jgi:hypothetical protein